MDQDRDQSAEVPCCCMNHMSRGFVIQACGLICTPCRANKCKSHVLCQVPSLVAEVLGQEELGFGHLMLFRLIQGAIFSKIFDAAQYGASSSALLQR